MMKKIMVEKIYLMRHGLTESNKKKIYAGGSMEGLCDKGMEELFDVAEKLEGFQIEKIISSPVRRAVQSAVIINSFLNLNIEIEDKFKEIQMGPWEGLSEDEVIKEYPEEWKIWNTKPSELRINDRETLAELQFRAVDGIKRLSDKAESFVLLVVTHTAVIRVLYLYYNEMPLDEYRKIDVPNNSIFLLDNKHISQVHLK